MKRKYFVFFIALFSVCVAVYILNTSTVVVSGDSMEPTYSDGDILFVSEINSQSDLSPRHPVCCIVSEDGSLVIKRLIGYPGDTVELKDGRTYINGELLQERESPSWDNMVFECGEDEYLFLGDNRAASFDARYWDNPFVSFSSIVSQVRESQLEVVE